MGISEEGDHLAERRHQEIVRGGDRHLYLCGELYKDVGHALRSGVHHPYAVAAVVPHSGPNVTHVGPVGVPGSALAWLLVH